MGGRQARQARIKAARESHITDAMRAVRAANRDELIYLWLHDAGQVLGDEMDDGPRYLGRGKRYHGRVQVSASGEIRVWDSVAGYYSVTLARELAPEQRASIERRAAKVWELPEHVRQARYCEDALFSD